MKCNKCWQGLEEQTKSAATHCGHLLCVPCAEEVISNGSPPICPVCHQALAKDTLKVVKVYQEPTDALRASLYGQAPEVILTCALSAIDFHDGQMELVALKKEERLKAKLQSVFTEARDRLQKLSNENKRLAAQAQQLRVANRALEEREKEQSKHYSDRVR